MADFVAPFIEASCRKEKASQVKKDRCSENNRIHAIQYAAMPADHRSPILCAQAAFHSRKCQPATKAHDHDDKRHDASLKQCKGCDPPQRRSDDSGANRTANKSLN